MHSGRQYILAATSALVGVLTSGCIDVASAQHPSFDCRRARSPDEITICSDSHLGELDSIGAMAFNFAKQRPGAHNLIANVQALLLARMACRSDKPCILQRQIEALRLYQSWNIPISIPDWVSRYRSELLEGIKSPPIEGSSKMEPSSASSRTAKCLLEVNGVHYIGDLCRFVPIDNKGSFRILDSQNLGLVAQVIYTKKDEGVASWNGPIGGNSPGQDLGTVYHEQGCWEGDNTRICAWNLDEQVSLERTPPEPSPDEVVYSGSRVGMYEDIISKEGLNSSDAIIKTAPSRKGSITFCREYSKDYTVKCIEDGLRNGRPGVITADCPAGRFVDFSGGRFQFLGKNNNARGDIMADYLIKDLKSGEILDGSSASGYGVEGGIFKALCSLAAPATF